MKKPARHGDTELFLWKYAEHYPRDRAGAAKFIRWIVLNHPHYWWMHQRYGTQGTEHTSRVRVFAIWFATTIYPMVVWKWLYMHGHRDLYHKMVNEGEDFKWRWFALGLFGK